MNRLQYTYNYEYTSSESLVAEVKEELKSYFINGQCDDLLFPLYIGSALKKLLGIEFPIKDTLIKVDNTSGGLPEDFRKVREIWSCYPELSTNSCDEEINIHLFDQVSSRQYKIHGCKIIFEEPFHEWVYIIYYSNPVLEKENPDIPENHRIQEYIKAFLKYKITENLYTNSSNENINQFERIYLNFKQQYLDAFILADAEIKKQTIFQKISSIKKIRRSLIHYKIE